MYDLEICFTLLFNLWKQGMNILRTILEDYIILDALNGRRDERDKIAGTSKVGFMRLS